MYLLECLVCASRQLSDLDQAQIRAAFDIPMDRRSLGNQPHSAASSSENIDFGLISLPLFQPGQLNIDILILFRLLKVE